MIVAQNLSDVSDLRSPTHSKLIEQQLGHTYPDLSKEKDPAWLALIDQASLVELAEDTEILRPHAPCTQFILLLDGRVRVYQQTPDDREITLYRLKHGDLCVLSINSLLNRKAFGAFARSETPVQALLLDRQQFLKAMAVSGMFREFVLTSLSDRFHDMLELMENTIFESLDTRLICLLGRMARASGESTVHITHLELARELGTSREVISRLLKGLERKGCIALGRGCIHMTG